MTRILVIAAHPDDEVLGCGGTIAMHVHKGDAVDVALLAQGLTSRGPASAVDLERLRGAAREANRRLGVERVSFAEFPDNSMDAVARLDIIKYVEGLVGSVRPSLVYTHFPFDLNVDHRRIAEGVATACRPQPRHCVETILFFEVPSSTEWQLFSQTASFSPNWFHDIGSVLTRKLDALHAYSSEMREWPHPRSYESVEHLARWRGATVGVQAAEAFVLGRRVIRAGDASLDLPKGEEIIQ